MSQYPVYSPDVGNKQGTMHLEQSHQPPMQQNLPAVFTPGGVPVAHQQYVYHPVYHQPPNVMPAMVHGYHHQHVAQPPVPQYVQHPHPLQLQQQQHQQQQQSTSQIAKEWEQIRVAKEKLALLEEKLQIEQELIKQEKKQRRRQRQIATQELHEDWQREMTLLQTRNAQVKEEYEAKLAALAKEHDATLQNAQADALGVERAKQAFSVQQLQRQHQEAIAMMEALLLEEKKKNQETEENAQKLLEQKIKHLQDAMAAQEKLQQQNYQSRQQQWLEKLHEQEQKQQERLLDLKQGHVKDYQLKCAAFQEGTDGRSIAEQKVIETEYHEKLLEQMSSRQAEHDLQLDKLRQELKQRDDAISELEKRCKETVRENQATGTSDNNNLEDQLAEKDAVIQQLKRELADSQSQQQEATNNLSSIEKVKETEVNALQHQLEALQAEQAEMASLVRSLEDQLAQKAESVERLEIELRERDSGDNDQAASLTSILVEREKTIDQLRLQVSTLTALNGEKKANADRQAAALQQKLVNHDQTILRLEQQLTEWEKKHTEACSVLQEDLSQLAGRATEKDDTIDRLKDELANKELELAHTLQAKDAALKQMKEKETALNSLGTLVPDLQQQLEEARLANKSDLYQAKEKLAATEALVQHLEEQVSTLTKERDLHLVADMDATFLAQQLVEKDEFISRLEAQLQEREQMRGAADNVTLSEKEETINRLEIQLMEMERELDEHKGNICRKCPALQEELEAIQAKYHNLEHEKKQASTSAGDQLKQRKEMAQLLRKEEQYKAKIETQENYLKELKEANAALAAQLEQGGNHSGSSSKHIRQSNAFKKNRKQVMEVQWKGSSTVDSGIYTGYMNDLGNPDGVGTLKFEDGSVYDGEWRDGNLHGEGVFAWVDGDTYHGEWLEGRQHGYGVFVWADGRLYQGSYKCGQRDGEGLMTWPYGARYRGQYKHDKRNGTGVYTYPDGRTYSGEYKDERPHGIGTEMAPDGSIIFTGEWSMGEFLKENTENI